MPNIVHEADAQRQYVRVPLPAQIQLSGHIYAMTNWSVRGATVTLDKDAEDKILKAGQNTDAVLIFEMDSFGVQIPMQVNILYIDQNKKRMGIVFQDPSPRQLSTMQQLVSAYISGELTSVEDMIHVVERNNFVKERTIPKAGPVTKAEQFQLYARKFAVFGVALLIFGYLLLSIYERNFIVNASNAYVDAGSFTVTTPSGGKVLYGDIDQGDPVQEGAPLASIQSQTGTIASLDSPCNCVMNQALIAQGAHANEGEAVLTLVPSGAIMYVTAYMPYEIAKELYEGQTTQIALAGGAKRMSGKIDYISGAPATKNELYQLRIVSSDPIDPSLLGTPAHVSIDTFR